MKRDVLISVVVALIITCVALLIPVTRISSAVFNPDGACALCGSTYPVKTENRGLPLIVVSTSKDGDLGYGSTFHSTPGRSVDFETYLATNPISYRYLLLDFLFWFALSFAVAKVTTAVVKRRE